jgi:hypothetical protein
MLAKENLMMEEGLQTIEEFNTGGENRMSYRPFSQTNYWFKLKLNET